MSEQPTTISPDGEIPTHPEGTLHQKRLVVERVIREFNPEEGLSGYQISYLKLIVEEVLESNDTSRFENSFNRGLAAFMKEPNNSKGMWNQLFPLLEFFVYVACDKKNKTFETNQIKDIADQIFTYLERKYRTVRRIEEEETQDISLNSIQKIKNELQKLFEHNPNEFEVADWHNIKLLQAAIYECIEIDS